MSNCHIIDQIGFPLFLEIKKPSSEPPNLKECEVFEAISDFELGQMRYWLERSRSYNWDDVRKHWEINPVDNLDGLMNILYVVPDKFAVLNSLSDENK